jgi:hypothetical protein
VRYDQCVGNCDCLPGRDLRGEYTTVHFSCIQPPVGDSGCVWGLLRGSSARMRSNEGAAANLARREHGGASGQLLTQQGPPPLRSTHRSMRRSYTSLGGTAPSTSEW